MICMLYVPGGGTFSRSFHCVPINDCVFPFLSVPVLFDVGYVHFIV